jgi:hypothetical protein
MGFQRAHDLSNASYKYAARHPRWGMPAYSTAHLSHSLQICSGNTIIKVYCESTISYNQVTSSSFVQRLRLFTAGTITSTLFMLLVQRAITSLSAFIYIFLLYFLSQNLFHQLVSQFPPLDNIHLVRQQNQQLHLQQENQR